MPAKSTRLQLRSMFTKMSTKASWRTLSNLAARLWWVTALIKVRKWAEWHLWHSNADPVREESDGMQFDAEALETDYTNVRKFLTAIGEFQSYIASNGASLINYGERYRSVERIPSAFVEATVNSVISKRFARKQQMQCSSTGAHLLLQTRTQTLGGSLRSSFRHGIGHG
jgi:hypothetical protein